MAETTENTENLRAAILQRVEAEVMSELAQEQRKAALQADPDWAVVEAQMKRIWEQQTAIEERILSGLCETRAAGK